MAMFAKMSPMAIHTIVIFREPEAPTNLSGIQVVVAATHDMGIEKDGTLPWKLPS